MTHEEYLLQKETIPKCTHYSGWFAFQDLQPSFAMFLMYDLVHNPEFMRAIDGKVYVSTLLLSAYIAGDDDWLHEGDDLPEDQVERFSEHDSGLIRP